MKKSTICFCIRWDEILLGLKKSGFGSGKWNGFGGKIEVEENERSAAVRELREESGLDALPNSLEHSAIITFSFEGKPAFECFVYLLRSWQGEPREADEMMRPQWFQNSAIPFDQMWAADRMWLPLVLKGRKFIADVDYSKDGTEVRSFSYKETVFE